MRRLKQESEDEEVGTIVLDVVLGEGAHPDPASELAPAIAAAKKGRKDLEFIVLIVGTDEDPQDLAGQSDQFEKAGAHVFHDLSDMLDHILGSRVDPESREMPVIRRFSEPLATINVGVETFYESLKAQGAEAIQVDWRPPAGGNEDLMSILEKMRN